MNEYKVLSINPGVRERLPVYHRTDAETRAGITPAGRQIAGILGMEESSRIRISVIQLVLRIIAGVAIIGTAVVQIGGGINVFGLSSASYGFGIAALVLGVLMATGLLGRVAALGVAVLTVLSLIDYAAANAGVADFSPENQISLIYGALAAVVAVWGSGRYTLQRLLVNIFENKGKSCHG